MDIVYFEEDALSAEEFRAVLIRSTLGERRPIDDLGRMDAMVKNASIIITARNREGLLVGVSRAISDFTYCTYLSDLAVDQKFQKHGIGRELIRRTHEAAGLKTTLLLIAAPKARDYYPRIGMQPHDSCWIIRGTDFPGAKSP